MSNSKPWGGTVLGSWAAEAEQAEAEARQLGPPPSTTPTNPQSFPSLRESVSSKPKKKKMSLSEFNTFGSGPGPSVGSTRLTPDELRLLPTAPKPRSDEDAGGGGPRLGGGFSNYGREPRREPRRQTPDYDVMPSRADEADSWASGKRTLGPGPGTGPGSTRGSSSRYSALGGGAGSGSRADEVDNWSMGKRAVVGPPVQQKWGGFGSEFRDSGSDWRRERERERVREVDVRPKLVLEVKEKGSRGNPFGEARPREEVLEEKGLDWKKLDMEMEAKKSGSRAGSEQGSRPGSAQSNRSENVVVGNVVVEVKARPKVNPFGDAKPREVLLEEKGLDWRKIDLELEHRRIHRFVISKLDYVIEILVD